MPFDFSDLGPTKSKFDFSDLGPKAEEQKPSVMNAISNISSSYQNSQLGAPQQILNDLNNYINRGASVGGQMLSTEMQRQGYDPTLSSMIGKVAEYTPLIASLGAPSGAESETLSDISTEATRRGLGFSKRFLKTSMARGMAAKAADVALEEGAVPLSGNPATAEQALKEVAARTGSKLNKMRSAMPADLADIYDSLDNVEQKLTQGSTGGAWDAIRSKIDNARQTLLGLTDRSKEITLQDVAEARKQIADSVSWLSDKASSDANTSIVKSLENKVENAFGDSKGIYKAIKRTYGGAALGIDALQNELATQEGNRFIGPYAALNAGMQVAAGNPGQAIAELGILEGLQRRGALSSARMTQIINKSPWMVPLAQSLGLIQRESHK